MRSTPSFNTWTVIFLFGAIQGIIFSLIFYFSGSRRSRAQKIFITIIMILFCLMIMEYVLFWTGYIVKFPQFANITQGVPFLFGPLLFFYFRAIFRNQSLTGKDMLHFAPFLIRFGLNAGYYFLPTAVKVSYITGAIKRPAFFLPWPWLMIIHMCIYTIVCYYEFYNGSKTTLETKKWFRLLLVLFSCFIASYLSYFLLVRFPWFNRSVDYMISFSMLFFIFSLAIYGYFQNKVFNGFTITEAAEGKKYLNSTLTLQLSDRLLEKLNKLMNEEKLFLEDDLGLERLAQTIGTTKHILSQILNEKIGMNFFEYINSRRIEEAKDLLLSTTKKELNIIEIAYRVGFTNKVTFNNTFKKFTGQTPSEFRKAGNSNKELDSDSREKIN